MLKNLNPNAQSSSKERPRRSPRSRSRVNIVIKYLGNVTPGRVFDISTTGTAIDLAGPFSALVGSTISIECTEFGVLKGNVRWIRNNRVGVEFDPTSNAAAQVKAYFRFFHKEQPGPVLKR